MRIPEERVPGFRAGYGRGQPVGVCVGRPYKLDCLVLDVDVLHHVSM